MGTTVTKGTQKPFSKMSKAEQNKYLSYLEEIHDKHLQAERTPVLPQSFGGTFGQDQPFTKNWVQAKALQNIQKAYDREDQVRFLTGASGHNGGPVYKATGLGPGLQAIAMLKMGVSDMTKEKCDKICEAHGLIDFHKAQKIGVKTISGERRKVALAESSGMTGGYLIEPEYNAELLRLAFEQAIIRSRCKSFPIAGRTLTIPALDMTTDQPDGQAYTAAGVYASWHHEAQTIRQSEPQFRDVNLTAWDLMLYSVSSNQLLDDNAIGLDSMITQLFSDAMTWHTEWSFLHGSGAGAGMPRGILTADCTIDINRAGAGAISVADLANMQAQLHAQSWDNVVWMAHQSTIPEFIQMSLGTNSELFAWLSPTGSDGINGPLASKFPTALLNGRPLFFTEKLPQLGTRGDLILADWSTYLIGERMDVQIDVSEHDRFRTNQLAWRVAARLDGQPWLNNFVTDPFGHQQSPFIVLTTP